MSFGNTGTRDDKESWKTEWNNGSNVQQRGEEACCLDAGREGDGVGARKP